MEDFVAREYERLRPNIGDFCGCDLCRDDVMVFALNRLSPHYVTQKTGEVLTDLALRADQQVANVSVVLLDGFRRVKAKPRAEHPPPD